MLENNYYRIVSRNESDFVVELIPECPVYQGHFPGEPISPGVCNIQMVRELAEKVAGHRLFMNHIKQVRLTTLITPLIHSRLDVTIALTESDGVFSLRASVGENGNSYLEVKAELTLTE